jgi:MFS family permease
MIGAASDPSNGIDDADSVPAKHMRLTGQIIGTGFMVRYVLALVGVYIAVLTPASVTLAIRVGQINPDGKATSLAFVASFGAAAALVANPLLGSLSDHSTLRWGQRRPFIIGGVLLGVLAVIGIGFARSIGEIAFGWVLAQFAFNAASTALVAILPERIPMQMRGRVAGFMGMTAQVAMLSGTAITQFVGTSGYGMFVWPSLAGVMLTLPFVTTLREHPRSRAQVGTINWRTLASSFWINPIKHRDFALAWLGRFFVWFANMSLLNFKTYFLIDRLGYSTATVAPVLTTAMLIMAVSITCSSIFGGWISDQTGRRKIYVVGASLLFASTMVIVAHATTLPSFFVAIALAGVATGLYMGVDYALVAQVLPDNKDQAAKGMGFFNLTSTIPQTLAPVLGPVLLSIGASGRTDNYTALFLAGALFAVIGASLTQLIRTN